MLDPTPIAMWLVAFSATAAASAVAWTAHRLRGSIERHLQTVEANEQRSVEHRLALERESIDIPTIGVDSALKDRQANQRTGD